MLALKLREAWVARHYEDFRIAGVVAQIKWLAVGSRGEQYMKNLVRERMKTTDEMKHDLKLSEAQNYLEHFGIKGMRWGVRNDTSSGVKSSGKFQKPLLKLPSKKLSRNSGITRYREKPKHLTDNELNDRIKRIEAEIKYKKLNKKYIGTGRKNINEVLGSVGKKSATKVGTQVATIVLKKSIEKRFGAKLPGFTALQSESD